MRVNKEFLSINIIDVSKSDIIKSIKFKKINIEKTLEALAVVCDIDNCILVNEKEKEDKVRVLIENKKYKVDDKKLAKAILKKLNCNGEIY